MHIRSSKDRDKTMVMKIARMYADAIGLADKKAMLEEHIGTSRVICACDDSDKPLGFVYAYLKGAGHSLYKPGRKELFVSAICVHSAHHRQGLATAMLQELVQSNTHRHIVGNVKEANAGATALYRKCGFEADSIIRFSRAAEPRELTAALETAAYHLRPFEVSGDAETGETLNDLSEDEQKSISADVESFFKKNEDPSDSDFHAYVEDKGINPHVAEEAVYRIVSDLLYEDKDKMPETEKTAAVEDEVGRFWIVTYPWSKDTKLVDMLFETDIAGIGNQFRGGLESDDIHGVYKDKAKAEVDAMRLMKAEDFRVPSRIKGAAKELGQGIASERTYGSVFKDVTGIDVNESEYFDDKAPATAAFSGTNFLSRAGDEDVEEREAPEVSESDIDEINKLLPGGKSEEMGITEADVDADELAMGMEIEMEHTDDPAIAKRISLDHLSEFGDYYTRLKKLEEDAKKELGLGKDNKKSDTDTPDADAANEPAPATASKTSAAIARIQKKAQVLDDVEAVENPDDGNLDDYRAKNTAPVKSYDIDRIDGTSDSVNESQHTPHNVREVEEMQNQVSDFKPITGDDVESPVPQNPSQLPPTREELVQDQLQVEEEPFPKRPVPQEQPGPNDSGSSRGSKIPPQFLSKQKSKKDKDKKVSTQASKKTAATIAELEAAGAEFEEDGVVLYRGGDVPEEVLRDIRYNDYLSAVETGTDAMGNAGADSYGKNVIRVVLPIADVEVKSGEIQYRGESSSLEGGKKYPLEIYIAYNDVYGSNYTAEEIDKQDNVRAVASQGLSGGREEFDELMASYNTSQASKKKASTFKRGEYRHRERFGDDTLREHLNQKLIERGYPGHEAAQYLRDYQSQSIDALDWDVELFVDEQVDAYDGQRHQATAEFERRIV